jgi:hypothetical protein
MTSPVSQEPRKAALLEFQAHGQLLLSREAIVTIIIPALAQAVEAIVELSPKGDSSYDSIVSWKELPGRSTATHKKQSDPIYP